MRGNQFRKGGSVCGGAPHRPRHVLNHLLCLQGAECANLNDPVGAILLADILDDLVPAAFAEVDIEVRGADALRVEEPFKEKVVFKRVDMRDSYKIRNQGACAGPTPRPQRDSDLCGIVQEIPDHQVVADESHALDDAQFVFHALHDLPTLIRHLVNRRVEAISPLETINADLMEMLVAHHV